MKRKWTKNTINQAFDEFVKKYDRLPTREEMYKKYRGKFPRPLSVKIAFDMTLSEYFNTHYSIYLNRCQARIYDKRTKEYWVEDFKKQYIEYDYPVEAVYNKLRNPKTPNTRTMAKIIGVTTWTEVLDYCGLQKDNRIELTGELIFEETLENYEALNAKLQNLIKKYQ